MKTVTRFTLLGTGSSGGVPRIGNLWGACDPANPKNRRRRCSMLVERIEGENKTSVLIDTGPDMREQLLSASVSYLDAVLLTHSHADHIFGLDDLRQLAITHRERVNVYMDEDTQSRVMPAFGYCFEQADGSSYPAICELHKITALQAVNVSGAAGELQALPFEVEHGDIHALGFRFDNLVYLPDVKTVSKPNSLAVLENIDTLILDSLRKTPHPTHMNVEEALAFIEQVKPRRAILTNMHIDLDYQTLSDFVPSNVEVAYDGMTIQFTNT